MKGARRMSPLKPLAIAATLIATLAPAKAEIKVGDTITIQPILSQAPLLAACSQFNDAYEGWKYELTYNRPIAAMGNSWADVRQSKLIRQNWIDAVNNRHEQGRYCVQLNGGKIEYEVYRKNSPFLCIKRKDGPESDACVWALLRD
jgi:hypothetical protein